MTATSAFTTTTVEVPASLTNLTTYNAIVNKLNKLWDDQMTAVQQVTDVSEEWYHKLAMTAVQCVTDVSEEWYHKLAMTAVQCVTDVSEEWHHKLAMTVVQCVADVSEE